MIAYGYDRVSTLKQVGNSSLATQKDAIRAYCASQGWTLKKIYTDPGLSAKDDKRPGLQRAISAACRDKGVLIFYDFTRFCRSLPHALRIAEELRSKGAGMYGIVEKIDTTNTSPAGDLMFHVLAACAQFQRALIGHKVKEANARKVSELGYRTQGRQPIGWKVVNGRRVPCERERALVARVRAVAEGKSLHEAARILSAAEEPTISQLRHKQSKEGWTARKVQHLLRCELNPVRRQGEELLGFEVAPLPAPVS
jgi:DNA invertase Pin-like site-specific DNA recombinase